MRSNVAPTLDASRTTRSGAPGSRSWRSPGRCCPASPARATRRIAAPPRTRRTSPDAPDRYASSGVSAIGLGRRNVQVDQVLLDEVVGAVVRAVARVLVRFDD